MARNTTNLNFISYPSARLSFYEEQDTIVKRNKKQVGIVSLSLQLLCLCLCCSFRSLICLPTTQQGLYGNVLLSVSPHRPQYLA